MAAAGKRNERVEIQFNGQVDDDVGQRVLVWTRLDEVWAEILFQNGKEHISGARETSSVVASVRIGFRRDINAAMRLVWGEQIFDIKAVLPDMLRRAHVDLVVEQGANDG